jgi:hypothetical protein
MAGRIDLMFSMTARDLSLLAFAMKFISGVISNEEETLRGFLRGNV